MISNLKIDWVMAIKVLFGIWASDSWNVSELWPVIFGLVHYGKVWFGLVGYSMVFRYCIDILPCKIFIF